jgi:hypothetical protein
MKNSFDERFESLRNKTASETPADESAQAHPQLSFVIPTELVDLPSRGLFYPDGHPLKDQREVEIRQMTAKEEDILTNKSFIRKGIVVDRLIEAILVDRSIDVSTLLVGDKNAIMVAARKSAYGSSYDVTLTCQECSNKAAININLDDITVCDAEVIEEKSKTDTDLIHTRLESGGVLVKLPKTGWYVECKLLNGIDEKKLLALLDFKRKSDPAAEITLSEQLGLIIVAINTFTERSKIIEAIQYMPAYDAKYLRSVYQKLIPNVKIERKYLCGSCGIEQEVEVPFTQEFFWPK